MKAVSFHYDCDPGQDDAVALLYGLACPSIAIESVSVVGGNASVEDCAFNALRILALAGRTNVPVYKGAQKPLVRALKTLPEVFGPDGLAGGEGLPASARAVEPESAADYLERLLSGSAQPVNICATGPLTNLALVLRKKPELAENIAQLVLMGGCPYPEPLRGEMGNFTPEGASGKAEYNFGVDPEAAAIVLDSGIREITMIGLNVTRMALYGAALDRSLRGLGNPVAMAAADILAAVGAEDQTDYQVYKTSADDPVRAMHDVLAFAWIDRPGLFKTEKVWLQYYTGENGSVPGQCKPVAEKMQGAGRYPIRVAVSMDMQGLNARIVEIFRHYNHRTVAA